MSYKKILSPANGSQLVPDTKLQEWKVVDSDKAPTNTNLIWNKDGILKKYEDGEWVDALEGVYYALPPNIKLNLNSILAEYVNKIDWSKCKGYTNVYLMFYNCSSLQSLDLSGWDVSQVTTMQMMFGNCSSLQSLDLSNFDTSAVTLMQSMFYGCSSLQSLDLSNFDTSAVTYMSNMFSFCRRLVSLDLSSFDTSAVTYTQSMFYNCSSLQSLDLSSFDTSTVTYMQLMFYSCDSLQSLDLGDFDTSAAINMSNMFKLCSKLTTVTGTITGLGNKYIELSNLCLTDCPLTRESALVFINGLVEKTDGKTYTLQFSTTTKALLTDEDIAIATAKGWAIA